MFIKIMLLTVIAALTTDTEIFLRAKSRAMNPSLELNLPSWAFAPMPWLEYEESHADNPFYQEPETEQKQVERW